MKTVNIVWGRGEEKEINSILWKIKHRSFSIP
jgi:hypothetical protein